ncbi:hypothetical protein J1N35_045216 [Gossypium stocksii]|uniref:CCHC-type domain-containing protein n=1 Tax=Gossypium stocksii TaxID=47602 RepID=A0A9D3UAR2_9ROSI|nr:hypothetical protein J1N35_045216 [Gossypium stocksii]
MVCFKCGRYGHINETCPSRIQTLEVVEKRKSLEQAIATTPVTRGGDYGPWMLVEQKVRRRNLKGVKEGVLEASNHLAVVFNNKSLLEVGNEELRDSHLASSNQAKVDYKSQSAENVGSKDGIWIGWKKSVNLKVVRNHPQFILTCIFSNLFLKPIFIAFVYGSPDKMKRRMLWNDLSCSIPRGDVPWMAIGDFNAVLSPGDKKYVHIKGCRCQFFGDFMDKAQLHDLGFQGPPFTWHRDYLSERLDRAVSNETWLDSFPDCFVTHLPRIKSDHPPLLLNLHSEDRISFDGNMTKAIVGFTDKLKNWNKCVYGHISQRKRHLLHKLSNVQNAMDLSGSNSLRQQELVIREELKSILYHEEILWKQKSRCEWLKLGDRNTSYFYRRTIQRRNFYKITALREANGDWVFDSDTLKSEAVNFFQKLYGETPGSLRNLPHSAFPGLSSEDVDFLGKMVTNEEIKVAFFYMAPFKALGSDGFQAGFFQNQWDNIGKAICQ